MCAEGRKGEPDSELSIPIGAHSETGCNSGHPNLPENLTADQEPVLVWVNGVCFYLHDEVAGQGKNPVKALQRRKRGKREKKICHKMAAREESVDCVTVKPVEEAFLTR